MKLTDTFKCLGFAGLLAVTGCVSAPITKDKSFPEQYGNLLVLERYENQVIIYLDRDGDNKSDLRLVYNINSIDTDGTLYLELIQQIDDKNRDGNFTEDEIVPYEIKDLTKLKIKSLI